MSLVGKVKVELFDKHGKIKSSIEKHNTITELGRMGCLTRGVASLASSTVYGANMQPIRDTGIPADSNGYMYKKDDAVVKCLLLNKNAAELNNLPFYMEDSSEIVGFATNATASTGVSGEGYRLVVSDSNGNTLGPTSDKVKLKYSFSGLVGDIKTIAMTVDAFALYHILENKDSSYMYGFIPEGLCGVPRGFIAQGDGSNYNKLYSLEDLSSTDFVPETTLPYAWAYYNCYNTFRFGNYNISFRNYYNSSYYIIVVNTATNTHYSTTFGTAAVVGFFIKNNSLYMITNKNSASNWKVYSCTVTDDAFTYTEEADTSLVDSSWLKYDGSVTYWTFVPIVLNNENYVYAISNKGLDYTSYVIKDMSISNTDTSNAVVAPIKCYHINNRPDIIYNSMLVRYLDSDTFAVCPVGQYGNLFSYFDLEDTYIVTAEDVVQVTYTYELEG